MMTYRALLLCALTVASAGAFAGKLPYTYMRVGNAADAQNVAMAGGAALMGGAVDVDPAFQWMCARSQGGDFLIVRASGADDYNAYVQGLCPQANSVATLVIPSLKAASHLDVAARIMQAEAIFIAGGDQSNYINYWTGTPTQAAIQARIDAGAPVGGISAGLNVLTQFVYSALASKGVTSSQALADPYNRYMSFARDFLSVPYLDGVIGDTHFSARDRMGRDLAFLGRVYNAAWSNAPRGIAVDEETALVVDETGQGTVMGPGSVYFEAAPGAPETCLEKVPLTYRNVAVYRIEAGGAFDLSAWQGTGGAAYTVSAENGVLTSSQAGGSPY
jgi:cyanophycinase